MAKKRRWHSKKEVSAFYKGLDGCGLREGASEGEIKSNEKGKRIRETDDYHAAVRFTDHMRGWYSSGKKDKYGRALDMDGRPLPTAYNAYCEMQKDPKMRQEIIDEYLYLKYQR